MNYKCQSCGSKLIKNEDIYRCINQECGMKNCDITIEKGWHDVFIRNENTEEVKTEKRWCTLVKMEWKK